MISYISSEFTDLPHIDVINRYKHIKQEPLINIHSTVGEYDIPDATEFYFIPFYKVDFNKAEPNYATLYSATYMCIYKVVCYDVPHQRKDLIETFKDAWERLIADLNAKDNKLGIKFLEVSDFPLQMTNQYIDIAVRKLLMETNHIDCFDL